MLQRFYDRFIVVAYPSDLSSDDFIENVVPISNNKKGRRRIFGRIHQVHKDQRVRATDQQLPVDR